MVTLAGRLSALVLLISLELYVAAIWVRQTDFSHQTGFMRLSLEWLQAEWVWGGTVIRSMIAVAAAFVGFGLLTCRTAFQQVSREIALVPVARGLLGAHISAVLAFTVLTYLLFGEGITTGPLDLYAVLWLGTALITIALAGFAIVPFRALASLVRRTGNLWILAAATGFGAGWIEKFRHFLWQPLLGLTTDLVTVLLHPFVSGLAVDRTTGTFTSRHFQLIVTPECSGLQGAGMMLAFALAWIWVLRRECRFPQVLLLIPASISLVWFLNSIRLMLLFLVGANGAPDIAMVGFHSQAGWIAFSGVALGFTAVLHRVPGLTKPAALPESRTDSERWENPSYWYLAPFLGLLASGMVARAASSGFEWLYPLRFAVVVAALWRYRRKYTRLDWTLGSPGIVAGCIAFGLWLALDSFFAHPSSTATAAGLSALGTLSKTSWILIRVLSASLTVPLAEELAFRAFLLRRLAAQDFESVQPAQLTWWAIFISSVAFGILHGDRWVAGTIAGLLYALAFRARGRFGDALVAHVITNALLAILVVVRSDWQLW